MLIGIREIKKAYPHINNKDIDMVISINKPSTFENEASINGHDVIIKQYLKSDIEGLFGSIPDKF